MTTAPATSPEWSWPDPKPPTDRGEVPPLPSALLPEHLANFAFDEADRMCAPVEFVAVPLLVAIGAVLGRRVALAPKARDPWHEFPNLWGACVGPPGSMKSPAISTALAFVRDIELAAEAEWRSRRLQALLVRKVELEAAVTRGAAAIKKGTGSAATLAADQQELRDVDDEINGGPPRLTTSDATIEKLGELLRSNPRGMLLTRDELAGWLRTLDRDGRSGEREAWLELWAGREPLRVDRIGRGSLAIPPTCVSIIGGIQPGKLSKYVDEAGGGGVGADGLLQRFGLVVWPEVPDFELVDRAPATGAADRVRRVFERLADPAFVAGLGGRRTPPGAEPAVLRFDAEAQQLASAWLNENGQRTRDESAEVLAAWLAKRTKTFCALALISHAVEVADGNRGPGPVSLGCAERAAAMCDLAEAHATKIYGEHADPGGASAAALASKIRAGAVLDGDSMRDIYGRHWKHLKTPEDVRAAVEALHELGWADLEKVETGGRPSVVLRINPKLEGS